MHLLDLSHPHFSKLELQPKIQNTLLRHMMVRMLITVHLATEQQLFWPLCCGSLYDNVVF